MHGLRAADIAVIALYLVGIAIIGVRSGRGLQRSADFFMPRRFGKFMMWRGELYLPWQMVFYLSAGLMAGVIVSLLTKPVPKEKRENLYALLRTPVRPGEQVEAPCTLPADAVVPERRNLFPGSNLEIPVPSRAGMVGFLVGCACVGILMVVPRLIVGI